jgi:hypothetical protein
MDPQSKCAKRKTATGDIPECCGAKQQSISDPRNSLSLAAIYGAILGDADDPTKPIAATIFNVDVTSVELGRDHEVEALITEEAIRLIREHNLSITVTAAKEKYRTAKVMTLVNAAGSLCCTLVIIKDRDLERADPWVVRVKAICVYLLRSWKKPFCC